MSHFCGSSGPSITEILPLMYGITKLNISVGCRDHLVTLSNLDPTERSERDKSSSVGSICAASIKIHRMLTDIK